VSNKVSVLVYSRKVGSPVRKAVLVYFAERASDGGEGIWASKSTIADAIECGRSTVIRTINEFVAEGILTAVGTRKHTNGETIEYAMNLAAIEALPPIKDNPSRNSTRPAAEPVPERDQSQSGTPPSRSGTTTRPAAGHKPPIEPPLNRQMVIARARSLPVRVTFFAKSLREKPSRASPTIDRRSASR